MSKAIISMTMTLMCLPTLALGDTDQPLSHETHTKETKRDYIIGMKVLVITAGTHNLEALPEWLAQSYGHDYDVLSLTQNVKFNYPDCSTQYDDEVLCGTQGINTTISHTNLSFELFDNVTNNPKYNAIILTSNHLGFQTVNGDSFNLKREIALTPEAAAELDDYCIAYNVRTVILNSNPRDIYNPAVGAEEQVVFATDVKLMTADNEIADRIRTVVSERAKILVGGEVTRWSEYWITPARLLCAENKHTHIIPVVDAEYPCRGDSDRTCRSIVALVITDPTTSRETLHFFLSTGDVSLHGITLGHIFMPWVTKGLFFGQRRVSLATQVDAFDFNFFESETHHQCQALQHLDAPNLVALSQLQDDVNMNLPTGSNYTAELLIFDGSGCGSRVDNTMADIAAAFVWVTASTDLEMDESTIERIRETANSVFRESKHAETSWSPLTFVTPSADGLNYTSTIDDILRMGYRNTVGDDLLQGYSRSSPWHSQTPSGLRDENGNVLKGVDTEAFQKRMYDKYGTSFVTIVPRLTTRIYHDVSTPRQLVRKLNGAVYRRKDRHSYDDIMKLEGFEVAKNMLSFRQEPYKFHPANLEQFKAGTSLLQEWVNSALAWVKAYTNFPVYTYNTDDLAELYRQRESRDRCQIKGTIQYLEGRPVALEVTSQSACDAKVTYTDTDGAYDFQPQLNDRRRGVSDASGDVVFTLKLAGDGSSHTVRLSGAADIETAPTVNTSTEDGTELEAEDSEDRALTPSITLDTVVSDRGSTTRATPTVLSPTTTLGLTSQTPTVPSGGQGNTVSTSTTIDAASNSGTSTSQSLSADEGIAISSSQASEFSAPATTFTLSSTTATGTATTETWASTSTITQTETGAGLSGPVGISNGGQSSSSDEAVATATGVSSDTQSERVSDTVSSEPLSTSANNPIGADSAGPVSTQTLLFPSVTDASPTTAGASASSETSPTLEATTSRIIDLPVASDAETSTSSPEPSSEMRSGSGSGEALIANSSAGTLTGAAIAGLVIGVLLVLVPFLVLLVFMCRRRRNNMRGSLASKDHTNDARASDFVPFGPFDTHSTAAFSLKNAV